MRILKILLSILIILVCIFFIGGFLIPDEWKVTRSIVIQASPEKIYPFISDFKQWDKWSPWNSTKDATLKYTYEGPNAGIGSTQRWISKNMGTGWMRFTSANPQRGVSYDLFININETSSSLQGNIKFIPVNDHETTLIWTDRGHSGDNYLKRWFSLMLKPMLEKDLDLGLTGLKTLSEK